jgi:hypothetical protein
MVDNNKEVKEHSQLERRIYLNHYEYEAKQALQLINDESIQKKYMKVLFLFMKIQLTRAMFESKLI